MNQTAHKMPTAELQQAHKMPKRCLSTQRPAGRPPTGAALVDGKWHATPESIAVAVERLLAQRERVRRNRHAARELLRRHRPELFSRARVDATQTTLVSTRADMPINNLEQYRRKDA